MFVVIIVVVIFGLVVECMIFLVFLILIILWSILVYDFIVYWVWGINGWLRNLGVFDFVGGNFVEINLGVFGFIVVIVIGKRKRLSIELYYILMVIFGGGFLWFGWFGFNVGSVFFMNYIVVNVFVIINILVVVGVIVWVACEWIFYKKFIVLGIISGVIVGLVVII